MRSANHSTYILHIKKNTEHGTRLHVDGASSNRFLPISGFLETLVHLTNICIYTLRYRSPFTTVSSKDRSKENLCCNHRFSEVANGIYMTVPRICLHYELDDNCCENIHKNTPWRALFPSAFYSQTTCVLQPLPIHSSHISFQSSVLTDSDSSEANEHVEWNWLMHSAYNSQQIPSYKNK